MDLVNTPITKFILIVTATSSILVQSSKLLIFGEKLPAFLDLCSKAFVFRHTGDSIQMIDFSVEGLVYKLTSDYPASSLQEN